jgi:hypothetical protein
MTRLERIRAALLATGKPLNEISQRTGVPVPTIIRIRDNEQNDPLESKCERLWAYLRYHRRRSR